MNDIDKITITLPFLSLSVNEAYAGYRVRHKSDKYKEFENKMEAFFISYGKNFKITGESFLNVTYKFFMPLYFKNGNIKKIDVANYEKVLSDTLSHHIEGFNDEKIKILILKKIDSNRNEVEIEISEEF